VSLCRSDAIRGGDKVRKLGRRIVRGDALVLVPEQHLTVLEGNARGPEPAAERVLQIMHTNAPESLRVSFHRIGARTFRRNGASELGWKRASRRSLRMRGFRRAGNLVLVGLGRLPGRAVGSVVEREAVGIVP